MGAPLGPPPHTCGDPWACCACAYERGRREQHEDDRAHVADLLGSLLAAHADLDVRWRRLGARLRYRRVRSDPRPGDFTPAGWPTEDVKRWVREGV